jgi:hypothetical protein
MNFETPGRLPPLGRVTHHSRPLSGPFLLYPGRRLRMSPETALVGGFEEDHDPPGLDPPPGPWQGRLSYRS